MIKVFVYGTLKSTNHHPLMRGAKFISFGTVEGFKMLDLHAFPGVVPGEGRVNGEVHEISPELFKQLDRYEGYPSLYTRQEVEVHTDSGPEMAWMYVFNTTAPESFPVIDSGVW